MGQKRPERKEGKYKIVIITTYTSKHSLSSTVSFKCSVSLLLYIPSSGDMMHTYRRRNKSSKRCHDSNTLQSNHANRHHQVLHLYIYIYYILYFICSFSVFLKSSFAAYMRNKSSNTSGNIFNAKPRVGVFLLRLKDFLGNCWKCGLAGGNA